MRKEDKLRNYGTSLEGFHPASTEVLIILAPQITGAGIIVIVEGIRREDGTQEGMIQAHLKIILALVLIYMEGRNLTYMDHKD
mmetsp:Transcript_23608/g.3916  ORF Transcript_23608/g.3916 Transcript_23608/m.3916 type:complete len:83 (+) Transcript_23608:417-665(+)